MFKLAKRMLAAAVVTLSVAGTAAAGDNYGGGYGFTWKKVVHYDTVTTYVEKQVAYTDYVTDYDHCYKPYQKAVTRYRVVQVPVNTQVPVVKWVKVPTYGGYNGGGY